MLAPFGIRPKGTLAARMLPLARCLTGRGHQVAIVAPPVHNPEDAGARAEYDGVLVAHTAAPALPGPLGVAQQTLALLHDALAYRPEVLHLFKPKGYSGLAALLARHMRPNVALIVDTDDWEGPGGWNDLLPYPIAAKRFFAWQERDLPRRAAAVTVASRALETLVWSFGVAPDRVFYLPNGVDAEIMRHTGWERRVGRGEGGRGEGGRSTLRPYGVDQLFPADYCPPTANLLLYTRFWELDIHEVIAALAGIAARHPAARLVIVGKGERGEEHELLRLAERAGLAALIDYRGWATPEQIAAALTEADVALMPMQDTLINRARGLAKLLELMGAGLPIVASRVGQAAAYLEHDVSGLLTPPGDAGALAAAVLRLLDDVELRRRLSAGAYEAAMRHSWDILALTAEQAYRRARE